jgi:V/A-type H+-transporting ATPase subunit E
MSCRELIESLRKGADEKGRVMQQEAEQAAGTAKAEVERRLERLRSDADKQRMEANREAFARALSVANNRARAIRLSAEQELSVLLKNSAASSLATLRRADYEEVFAKMARELPALAWHTVRVNPGDAALAAKYFPGAEIVPDRNITGGMDASIQDGSIRVINTFEKRLERSWSDMLPLLIRDIYGEGSDGTPAAS